MKNKYNNYYRGFNKEILDQFHKLDVQKENNSVGTVVGIKLRNHPYTLMAYFDGNGWVYLFDKNFYSDIDFLKRLKLKAFI